MGRSQTVICFRLIATLVSSPLWLLPIARLCHLQFPASLRRDPSSHSLEGYEARVALGYRVRPPRFFPGNVRAFHKRRIIHTAFRPKHRTGPMGPLGSMGSMGPMAIKHDRSICYHCNQTQTIFPNIFGQLLEDTPETPKQLS